MRFSSYGFLDLPLMGFPELESLYIALLGTYFLHFEPEISVPFKPQIQPPAIWS